MRKRKFLFFIIILIFIFVGSCSERKEEGEEEKDISVNEEFSSFKNEKVERVNMKRKKEREKFTISLRKNPFLRWEEEKKLAQKKMREIINYLNLTAIFYSPSKSFAVIDGYVVEEGDTIAGKKVIEINPKAVILKDEKGEYILPLKEK